MTPEALSAPFLKRTETLRALDRVETYDPSRVKSTAILTAVLKPVEPIVTLLPRTNSVYREAVRCGASASTVFTVIQKGLSKERPVVERLFGDTEDLSLEQLSERALDGGILPTNSIPFSLTAEEIDPIPPGTVSSVHGALFVFADGGRGRILYDHSGGRDLHFTFPRFPLGANVIFRPEGREEGGVHLVELPKNRDEADLFVEGLVSMGAATDRWYQMGRLSGRVRWITRETLETSAYVPLSKSGAKFERMRLHFGRDGTRSQTGFSSFLTDPPMTHLWALEDSSGGEVLLHPTVTQGFLVPGALWAVSGETFGREDFIQNGYQGVFEGMRQAVGVIRDKLGELRQKGRGHGSCQIDPGHGLPPVLGISLRELKPAMDGDWTVYDDRQTGLLQARGYTLRGNTNLPEALATFLERQAVEARGLSDRPQPRS